jgi:transposase-like protein
MYIRYPLSLHNVEDLLFERGIDICHETVRLWWNRFGPMFAGEIRRKRVHHMRAYTHWKWHLDEVYVKINGEMRYLWRAVDQESEVLESLATKERDKAAALKFMKKLDEAPRDGEGNRHCQTNSALGRRVAGSGAWLVVARSPCALAIPLCCPEIREAQSGRPALCH